MLTTIFLPRAVVEVESLETAVGTASAPYIHYNRGAVRLSSAVGVVFETAVSDAADISAAEKTHIDREPLGLCRRDAKTVVFQVVRASPRTLSRFS